MISVRVKLAYISFLNSEGPGQPRPSGVPYVAWQARVKSESLEVETVPFDTTWTSRHMRTHPLLPQLQPCYRDSVPDCNEKSLVPSASQCTRCLVQNGNGIELKAVGLQFEPYLWRPQACGVTWDSSRTVVVIKLRRTSALVVDPKKKDVEFQSQCRLSTVALSSLNLFEPSRLSSLSLSLLNISSSTRMEKSTGFQATY